MSVVLCWRGNCVLYAKLDGRPGSAHVTGAHGIGSEVEVLFRTVTGVGLLWVEVQGELEIRRKWRCERLRAPVFGGLLLEGIDVVHGEVARGRTSAVS